MRPEPAVTAPADDRKLTFWLMFAVLVYGLWHLVWYWQTPLGQSPVLDERENLDLAAQIAAGTLPAEPFYRAMLYPLLLAAPFWAGVPDSWIPHVATFFGLLLHLVAALLAGRIAYRWFNHPLAGFVATALYGLNPVLVHYAAQILDATLGNVLFLAGLWSLTRAGPSATPGRWWLGGAVAWGFAALARPQLLVLIAAFAPVGWLLRGLRLNRGHVVKLAAAAALPVVMLLVQGLIQLQRSGTFQILPTQGAYNLWAANKPGANGRYFAQSIYLPAADQQQNPTRIESLVLYQRETGDPAPDLASANRHWQRRFREALAAEPLAVVSVQLRKLYYLLNHQEQYNNKTYSFHKERSPALRLNPVGWGWLWSLGLAGGATLLLRGRRRLGFTLMFLFAVLAAGVLTGYASGRFRLPLVALLACCAGGVSKLPELGRGTPRAHFAAAAALWVMLTVFAFTRFGDVVDRSTYLQDHLLAATAAERTGDDVTAWKEAANALVLSPGRPDALAMRVTSYFNLLLSDTAASEREKDWWQAAEAYLSTPFEARVADVEVTAAFALWRAGKDVEAEAHLRRLVSRGGTKDTAALAALVLTGRATPDEAAAFAKTTTQAATSPFETLARTFLSRDDQRHPQGQSLAPIVARLRDR